MGNKQKNLNDLINLFNNNQGITLEYIKDELQIKERSAKAYIKELREIGFNIVCKNGIYCNVGGECAKGRLISKNDMREMVIISVVGANNGQLNKRDLVDKIKEFLCDQEVVSEKTICRAIKSCEEKNIIKEEDKVYKLTFNVRNLVTIKEEYIYKFMDNCDIYRSCIPFINEVKELKNKIEKECGYVGWDNEIFSMGRKYEKDNKLKYFLSELEKYDYRSKNLKIKFNSQKGVLDVNLAIITFMYSWDKDVSYIIGKAQGDIFFINVDTVISIETTEKKNCYFNDSDILKKVDLMFQASFDGPYHVKVQFNNIFNIKEKLIKLNKNRKYSTIKENKDHLVYEDDIYGIYDFANYLRRFGYACKVLEPVELQDIMKKTYERILINYGENAH